MCQEQCFGILELVEPEEQLDPGRTMSGTMVALYPRAVSFSNVHSESAECLGAVRMFWGPWQGLTREGFFSFSLLESSATRYLAVRGSCDS